MASLIIQGMIRARRSVNNIKSILAQNGPRYLFKYFNSVKRFLISGSCPILNVDYIIIWVSDKMKREENRKTVKLGSKNNFHLK